MAETLIAKAEPNAFKNHVVGDINFFVKFGRTLKLASAFAAVALCLIAPTYESEIIIAGGAGYLIGTILETAAISDAKYLANKATEKHLNESRPDYYKAEHANGLIEFGKSIINPIRGFMVTSQKRKLSLG